MGRGLRPPRWDRGWDAVWQPYLALCPFCPNCPIHREDKLKMGTAAGSPPRLAHPVQKPPGPFDWSGWDNWDVKPKKAVKLRPDHQRRVGTGRGWDVGTAVGWDAVSRCQSTHKAVR